MSSADTVADYDTSAESHDQPHTVPLWGLFLALLALTAAEVALFEVWSHSNLRGEPFMPKYAMVLILLIVLTIPKAAIVMIYFMHLKFERQLVVLLALTPLITAAIAVLPTLTDAKTLKNWGQSYNLAHGLGDPPKGENVEGGHEAAAILKPATPATQPAGE